MKSEKEQYPLGMLGQHWFGCESNEHNINSFNKCLLSDFYIHGTVLGSWDPPVKKTKNKQKKTKILPGLVELLSQQKVQTRNNRHKKNVVRHYWLISAMN